MLSLLFLQSFFLFWMHVDFMCSAQRLQQSGQHRRGCLSVPLLATITSPS